MAETLRDRQKQVAREMILQAASDEIVDKGLEEVSLQAVAERAGVSKRTLYNYFDSREALLSGISDWSDQLTLEMGGYLMPGGLDVLPDMIPAVWRTWKAQGSVYEAAIRIASASVEQGRSPGRIARHAAISQAVREVHSDLTDDQCDALASLVHSFSSAPVYWRLTAEDGLDVETAAALVAWNLRLIRAALERGDDPFSTDQPSPKEES
jgi:AcrR family transcriptional regulator